MHFRIQLVALILIITISFVVLPLLGVNRAFLFQLMLYMLLAEGINLCYGFIGYLPFGYFGLVGVGAYGCGIGLTVLDWSLGGSIAAGAAAALVIGLILRPLFRLEGAYFAIASLAAGEALFHLVANPALQNVTQGPYGITIKGHYAPIASYNALLGCLIVSLVVIGAIRLSRWGIALRAIKGNPISARMVGLNVVRARSVVWLLSAVLAGLGGALFAWNATVFYPETVFSLDLAVFPIVFMLFGGVGGIVGPLLGTAVLYTAYNYIGISLPLYVKLLYGVLIVALVLFAPRGALSLLGRRGHDVI